MPSRRTEVHIKRIKAAEIDEQWSFVAKKKRPRWLWHGIDHSNGKVLAYVLGRRQDWAFLKLKKLLKPFKIQHYYTDHYGSYKRHINAKQHSPGKRNTQKIEQKHVKFRTRIKRLARKTICFSKSNFMHDTVIGLFINRGEFGRAI